MKYYIFKTPKLPSDKPLEVLNSEPLDYLIQQKALKYGSIVVISEEELERSNDGIAV